MSASLEYIVTELRESLAWLKEKFSKQVDNRFSRILNELESLIQKNSEKAMSIKSSEKRDVYFYTLDAINLNFIVKALKDLNPEELPQRVIKCMLKGNQKSWEERFEDGENTPRNHQFELLLYSYLMKSKFQIESFEDIVVKSEDGYTYCVQCKRITKFSTFKKNLKKAYEQLNTKNDISGNKFGIIAISLDIPTETNRKWVASEEDVLGNVFDKYVSIARGFIGDTLNINLLGVLLSIISLNEIKEGKATKVISDLNLCMVEHPQFDNYSPAFFAWENLDEKLGGCEVNHSNRSLL